MADSVSPDNPKPEGFLVHLAEHVLLFDKRPAPDFNAPAGMPLLAIAIVVEALRLGRRKGINSGVRHGDPSVSESEAENLGHRGADIRDSRISGKIDRRVVLHKVEHAAVEHAAIPPSRDRG